MEVQPCDPLLDESRDEVKESDATRWIDIETDPDVQEVMVCDALDDIKTDRDSLETNEAMENV